MYIYRSFEFGGFELKALNLEVLELKALCF